MAAAVGISPSSVGRIRAQAGLKPHLTRGFKVSNDPLSEEKVTDIVGLCLDPPEPAVVLCVDEKSRIQALDRTRPGLPLRKRSAATMTHDDKRHGTMTLFAALDVKSGMVIGECRRAPPSQGVPEVPAPHRPCRPGATRRASGARQLRHPQDTRGAGLAGEASPVQTALHAARRVMAEPRRTVLCRDHLKAHPPRQLHQRRRTGGHHLQLLDAAQRQAQAIHLEQDRQRHPHPKTPRPERSR